MRVDNYPDLIMGTHNIKMASGDRMPNGVCPHWLLHIAEATSTPDFQKKVEKSSQSPRKRRCQKVGWRMIRKR